MCVAWQRLEGLQQQHRNVNDSHEVRVSKYALIQYFPWKKEKLSTCVALSAGLLNLILQPQERRRPHHNIFYLRHSKPTCWFILPLYGSEWRRRKQHAKRFLFLCCLSWSIIVGWLKHLEPLKWLSYFRWFCRTQFQNKLIRSARCRLFMNSIFAEIIKVRFKYYSTTLWICIRSKPFRRTLASLLRLRH